MEPPKVVSSSGIPVVISSSDTLSSNHNNAEHSSFSTTISNNSSFNTTNSNNEVTTRQHDNTNLSSNHRLVGQSSSSNDIPNVDNDTNIISLKQRVQQLETEKLKYQQQLLDREDELADLKLDVETQKKKTDRIKMELNEKRLDVMRLQSQVHDDNSKIDVKNSSQYKELKSKYDDMSKERDNLVIHNSDLKAELLNLREELDEAKARSVIVHKKENNAISLSDNVIDLSLDHDDIQVIKTSNLSSAHSADGVVGIDSKIGVENSVNLSVPNNVSNEATTTDLSTAVSPLDMLGSTKRYCGDFSSANIDSQKNDSQLLNRSETNIENSPIRETNKTNKPSVLRKLSNKGEDSQSKKHVLFQDSPRTLSPEKTFIPASRVKALNSAESSEYLWHDRLEGLIDYDEKLSKTCELFSVPMMELKKLDIINPSLHLGSLYLPQSQGVRRGQVALQSFLPLIEEDFLKTHSIKLKLVMASNYRLIIGSAVSADKFTSACLLIMNLISALQKKAYINADATEQELIIRKGLDSFSSEHEFKRRNLFEFYHSVISFEHATLIEPESLRKQILGSNYSLIKELQNIVTSYGCGVEIYKRFIVVTHKSDPQIVGVSAKALLYTLDYFKLPSFEKTLVSKTMINDFKNAFLDYMNMCLYGFISQYQVELAFFTRKFSNRAFPIISFNEDDGFSSIILPNVKQLSEARRSLVLQACESMNYNVHQLDKSTMYISTSSHRNSVVIGDMLNFLYWAPVDYLSYSELVNQLRSRVESNSEDLCKNYPSTPGRFFTVVSFLSHEKMIEDIRNSLYGLDGKVLEVIQESLGHECLLIIRETYITLTCEDLYQTIVSSSVLHQIIDMFAQSSPFQLQQIRELASQTFYTFGKTWGEEIVAELRSVRSGYYSNRHSESKRRSQSRGRSKSRARSSSRGRSCSRGRIRSKSKRIRNH